MPEAKNVEKEGEVREFPKGQVQVVTAGSITVTRSNMQPGWRWSECVKPIAGTESCQVPHNGYAISGVLGIRMDDGSEIQINPGDAYSVPSGHDGWVIGDEPFVAVDFSAAMAEYAKPS